MKVISSMEKRMVEVRSNTKMEMFMMDNGIKARSTVLVVIFKIKMTDSMKVFGEKDNTVVKRLQNSKHHFNFSDFNKFTRLSFILLTLFIKIFFLFRIFLLSFMTDDISMLVNIIS